MSSKSSKKTSEAPLAPDAPEAGAPRPDLPERVLVGRVLRPHGLRGEAVIEVLSEVPERWEPGSRLWRTDEQGKTFPGREAELKVASSRPHKTGRLVRFAGCESREDVEALRGSWLAVERSQVPPRPEGEYYHFELLGCRLRLREDGGERELGPVVDLQEDGGGLLLVVDAGAEAGGRLPIPFVREFLREVDVDGGTIVVELPEGFVEACGSTS
jgi:16S rRNA processing protein RimM